MNGARIRIAAIGIALAVLVGCPAPPAPVPQRPDADAAPAPRPVVHADCGAAGKHYAAVCSTADSNVTAGLCQAIVPNMPEYSDCLAKATNCNDGTACDNRAGAHRPPKKPPVNGH